MKNSVYIVIVVILAILVCGCTGKKIPSSNGTNVEMPISPENDVKWLTSTQNNEAKLLNDLNIVKADTSNETAITQIISDSQEAIDENNHYRVSEKYAYAQSEWGKALSCLYDAGQLRKKALHENPIFAMKDNLECANDINEGRTHLNNFISATSSLQNNNST